MPHQYKDSLPKLFLFANHYKRNLNFTRHGIKPKPKQVKNKKESPKISQLVKTVSHSVKSVLIILFWLPCSSVVHANTPLTGGFVVKM
jgi:hypothetical protein